MDALPELQRVWEGTKKETGPLVVTCHHLNIIRAFNNGRNRPLLFHVPEIGHRTVLAWGGCGRGRSRISTPWGTLVGQDPAATAPQQLAANTYIESQRWDSPAVAREALGQR